MNGWQGYNAERTHTDKYCYGKMPMQTFIESATLAHDKQLDRIKPTSESSMVVAWPACPSDQVWARTD